ncbi:MAG TPA: cyclic nucleotide-binding domain-containing protein [Geminicoccaceae bacterium]|jgi:CRP-like cAMP-binding protein|nr:cyclic nucleotide-binding domain-containing protein [Geminicoccaceae bacterium]
MAVYAAWQLNDVPQPGKLPSFAPRIGHSMYLLKRFQAGDVLFRQGDPSDHVVLITSGTVDVIREIGADSIRLGTAKEGEFLGEMGALESRARSATAVATSDVEVELIGRQRFLERVSREPELAHRLLLRMSSRLRDVDDMLARLHAGAEAEPRKADRVDNLPALEIAAVTYAAKFYVGEAPIKITSLPFTVGRGRGRHEPVPGAEPDLEIPEPEPFRLSRRHFSLLAEDHDVVIRDLSSELGTIVNELPLGRDFGQDAALLHRGTNRVVAGGAGSPFEFAVTLG